jgi:hypothetical protein
MDSSKVEYWNLFFYCFSWFYPEMARTLGSRANA